MFKNIFRNSPDGWVKTSHFIRTTYGYTADKIADDFFEEIRNYSISCDAGVANAAGYDSGIVRSVVMVAESGNVSVSGYDSSINRSLLLTADSSSVSSLSYDAGLIVSRQLQADNGTAQAAGYGAGLNKQYVIDASSGNFSGSRYDSSITVREFTYETGYFTAGSYSAQIVFIGITVTIYSPIINDVRVESEMLTQMKAESKIQLVEEMRSFI